MTTSHNTAANRSATSVPLIISCSTTSKMVPTGQFGKRLPLAIIAFAILVLAMTWAGVYWVAANDQEAVASDSMRTTANLTRALEEHSVRTFKYLDELALQVKAQYEMRGTQIDLIKFKENIRADPGLLIHIVVTGANGTTERASTDDFKPVSLVDREHFRDCQKQRGHAVTPRVCGARCRSARSSS